MSSEKVHVEHCKGVNGLDKVILREIRRCSAEPYFMNLGSHECCTMYICMEVKSLLGRMHMVKSSFLLVVRLLLDLLGLFVELKSTGSLEQYGFARNRIWSIDLDPPPSPSDISHKAFVDLILTHSEEDMKIWPHRYDCRLRVALGPTGELMLTSRIRNTNTDGKSFTFRFAYQTYFFVTDISEVRVEGLETLDYLDNLKNGERFTEQEDAITFESEVDKVYLSTPTKIAILDHERKRTFELRKGGLPDAVVWNPWDKKAKSMADFGDNEYMHMLCVEAACVEEPITLKPGEEWKGRQEISAVPSSYCSEQLDPRRLLLSG